MLGMQVPKSGLMGFGDYVHGEAKHLRVHFLWHGRPHVASLAEQVRSPALMHRVLQMQHCMCVVRRSCAIMLPCSQPLSQVSMCCLLYYNVNMPLLVCLTWSDAMFVALQEAGTLPDKGTLVTSESEASAILSAAAALEARLHPVSMRVQDNPAFSPEG